MREGNNRRVSGFMTIPLELRSPMGLAILALILTATPGTAWLDYNRRAARSCCTCSISSRRATG